MVMASSLLQRLLLKRAPLPPPFPIPPLPLLAASNTPSIELSPFHSSHSPLQKRESEAQAQAQAQANNTEIKVEASLPIFPAFPHLGPIWDPSGFWIGGEPVVRADSVKKKRKRKMNKHKLRKLRKQLRLRT